LGNDFRTLGVILDFTPAINKRRSVRMPAALEHAEFSKHLNTNFKIRLDEQTMVDAKLAEITEHLVSPLQERFAIVFHTTNDFFLGQGMRQVEHDQMGSFEIFLVPIRRDDQGTSYEAVFNRMVKK
jgi:hypothetical protein